jgi:RNA polymerase sigma factor (sigma-70 family)
MPHDDDRSQAQDQAWVHAVQQRDDRAAFANLVRRHQGAIRAVLRRLCNGDTGIADELAQESFLQAYRSLAGFRGESRFRTWLFRVAYNVYLQHHRRGSEQFQREVQALEPEAAVGQAGLSLSNTVALGLDLQRALARLSEAERQAIVYCHMAELSHTEAAKVLGWPLGTVKTHVLRGKEKLRESLAAWAPSPYRKDLA